MHGLILAGGSGTRLAADGVTTPKAFAPVAGQPQLLALVRQFSALGCSHITCMLQQHSYDWYSNTLGGNRPGGNALHGSRSCDGESTTSVGTSGVAEPALLPDAVTVIPCSTPSSLHTLVLGLASLPAGDVFCSMVDTVMSPTDWQRVYHESADALSMGADAALAVTRYESDDKPLWVHRIEHGQRVAAIGGGQASPPWITGGVYALSASVRPLAARVLEMGEERMRSFLAQMVNAGHDVRAIDVTRIIDIDHLHDLEAANEMLGAPRATRHQSEPADHSEHIPHSRQSAARAPGITASGTSLR